MAGTTTSFGLEILASSTPLKLRRASEVNGCGVLYDYSYMSGEEYIPGWSPARWWRNKQQRYGLVGEVCPHCEHKIFPPRDVCPNCGGEAKELFSMLTHEEKPEEVKTAAAIIVVSSE